MTYKHYHVINENGYPIEFVLVIDDVIQHYKLKDGEALVEEQPSPNLLKPRWNGSEWIEYATEKEIQVTLPSLDKLKETKAAEIRAISETKVAKIQEGYTIGEINTFEQQYNGAIEILTYGIDRALSKDAQFVINLARGRSAVGGVEVTPEVLAAKIVANYTKAKEYTVTVLSVQQGLETKVQMATSREDLAEIQWPETV